MKANNNMSLNKNKLKYFIVAVSILFTACGGGGGGGGGGTPAPGPTPGPTPGPAPLNSEYFNSSILVSPSSAEPKVNSVTINVNGASTTKSIGLYAEAGGKITNSRVGVIDVVSGVGIHAYSEGSIGSNAGVINELDNSWNISYAMSSEKGGTIINESTGVINVNNKIGMKVLDKLSTAINYGTINMNEFSISGMNALAGKATNEKTGIITGSSSGVGMFISGYRENDTLYGGNGINLGLISLSGDNAIGMYSQAGNITNEAGATIKLTGDNAVGMSIAGRGTLTNNGTIILTGKNSRGISIDGPYTKGINNGLIDLTGAKNSIGIYVNNGGVLVNNGRIELGLSGTNKEQFIDRDGSIGTGDGGYSFEHKIFDTSAIGGGKFIMSKDGVLSAKEIKGNIYVDSSKIAGLYSESGKTVASLIAEYLDINLISDSVMYNTEYKRNNFIDYSYDIQVERKKFNEVIANNAYSSLLQENAYDSKDSFKDKVYSSILSSTTLESVNKAISDITGDKIFPTIQKINYTQLADRNNHINDIAYKNSFNDSFANEEVVYFGDYSYSHLDSKSSETMDGYSENRHTALLGAHKSMNDSLRLGVALSIGQNDVDFDSNSSNLESTNYHLAPFALYKNKDYNFIFSPYAGYIDGELERDLGLPTRIKSDVETQYYGFYSEINRQIDFDSFYMQPKFEINGAKFTQKSINESSNSGVNIPETDYSTFTTGIGSSIGKKINLDNDYTITIELSGTYYHEFGNPNNNMENVSLDGFNGKFDFDSYNNNRDYGKIGAEVAISKNNIQGYAKYGYIVGQDSDDQKVTVGVLYKF